MDPRQSILSLAAGCGLLVAACTCAAPNAEIEGELSLTSSARATLQPLKAVFSFLGGDTIVECLRADSCPELAISMTNIFENRQDCSREAGLPFCFDLGLSVRPGRRADADTHRVCAKQEGAALTFQYLEFPGKTPGSAERLAGWEAGCVEFVWSGETVDLRFQDVVLKLDSGREVQLRGRFGLHKPRDRYTC